jgi:hypothetical protein
MTAGEPASELESRWLGSGLAHLTGLADGPGLVPPAGILARIDRLGRATGVDAFAAMAERARPMGLRRAGQRSCGGASRLLPARDAWVAATLARLEDLEAIPAWLGTDFDGTALDGTDPASEPGPDPWVVVADAIAASDAAAVVEQGALLGLAVAAVPARPPRAACRPGGLPGRVLQLGPRHRPPRSAPLVVDLSGLWAGPLCARTLAHHGCEVLKVEATARPDGARRGNPDVYDRLHSGQRAVAVDLAGESGRAALRALVSGADVVIEASRPRALEQLGIDVASLGPDGPAVWVSITGHGRTGPARERVAFGDDAAAAGGLLAPSPVGPVFVADAAADPLSGLAAAAGALDLLRSPGEPGRLLLDVALSQVAAWVAGAAGAGHGVGWTEVADPPEPPGPGPAPAPAAALGAHNSEVLAQLGAE